MKPLIALTRINRVESIHSGYICVADSLDKTILSMGDPNTKLYLRSSGKPFIAVALVNSGALETFNISLSELAILCSSHAGEDFHLDTIRCILKKAGIDEAFLDCGATYPINQDKKNLLIQKSERPKPIHNCCSGKHTGLLLLCRYYGFPLEGYRELEHPVQQLIHQIFAELLQCNKEDIALGIDGCGLPTCHLSLHQIAWLYSLLAKGYDDSGKYSKCFGRIQKAMITYPQMLSGYNEFCTELGLASEGRVIGKVGSEGLYCLAVPGKNFGVCIKIADGNERGVYPVAIHLLKELGVFGSSAMAKLDQWAYPPIKNHRGTVTGYTIPIFSPINAGNTISIGESLPFRSVGL
jgi:L-asparaginase II